MNNGRFITIEGIDGAGKSCNLVWIKSLLENAGKTVVCTREPGGTLLGEEIRNLLLQHRVGGMEVVTELLLLCAARAEHIATKIRPSLARGEWVLCDRFSDATYAYQGGGRGLNNAIIATAESVFENNLQPDLTFLFDVSVEISKARVQHRSASDRFDQETTAFFQRVRDAYLQRAANFPHRIRVIDANGKLMQVQQEILKQINDYLQ